MHALNARTKRLLLLAADAAIGIVACAFIAVGGWLGIARPLIDHPATTYSDSPPCPQPDDALRQPCWSRVPVQVIRRHTDTGFGGSIHYRLDLAWANHAPAAFTVEIVNPPSDFGTVSAGQTLSMKLWDGEATAVYSVAHNQAMRTDVNPLVRADLAQAGGIALLGVGAVLFLVHPASLLLWRSPRTLGNLPASALHNIAEERSLRLAFSAFVLLQFLDVLTSVRGGSVGLYEANPTAAALIRVWGEKLGLLGIKLPAVIATALALGRLPRRAALAVAWIGTIGYLYVATHNLWLILHGSG